MSERYHNIYGIERSRDRRDTVGLLEIRYQGYIEKEMQAVCCCCTVVAADLWDWWDQFEMHILDLLLKKIKSMRWSNTAQHSKTHIKKFIVISIILFAPVIVTDSIFVIMTRNYPWVHVYYFFGFSFVRGECRNCWYGKCLRFEMLIYS